MTTKASSVTEKAIILRSPSRVFYDMTNFVYTDSNGEVVFSFEKTVAPEDHGLWQIFTSDKNPISDIAGNQTRKLENIGSFVYPPPKVSDWDDIVEQLSRLQSRIVVTTDKTVDILAGDDVYIDGPGDIQFPTNPPDGAEIRIFDRFGKIKSGQNNGLLGAGDRWLTSKGTFDSTPMEFDDDHLRRGMMIVKYSASSQSWKPYILYGTDSSLGVSGTGLKRAVLTEDVTITAIPFDVIQLKGKGNIQIGNFEPLEYFDIQWNGTYSTTVFRATGLTIDGKNEDLLLDTANMGVTSIRLMRIDADFQVIGKMSTTSVAVFKKAILSGNTLLTANPFDVISLGGTGNIQIGDFSDLDYFEIQWSGNRSVSVLRPPGFTIDGADEDFLLNTAGMSVKRVRFMKIGSNFEVS